jgi:hypothetical protein
MGRYVGAKFLLKSNEQNEIGEVKAKGMEYAFANDEDLAIGNGDAIVVNTRYGTAVVLVTNADLDRDKVFEKFPQGEGLQSIIAVMDMSDDKYMVGIDDTQITYESAYEQIQNAIPWLI